MYVGKICFQVQRSLNLYVHSAVTYELQYLLLTHENVLSQKDFCIYNTLIEKKKTPTSGY